MEDQRSVGLYARVSSQKQADELTIESQVAAIKDRIQEDGLHFDEALCFLDEGYSGAMLVRPALERLRDVAWAGGIDRLYVHSPDRLARKYAYQVVLLEEFTKHDVEVMFLNHDPQEHPSAEGNLLLQMQGMISEYERAKILERTRRGRRFSARQGKVSAIGHAPHGYRYVTKREGDGEARWDVVMEDARVVQEMFSWVGVEGLSLGEVVGRLAEREIPSPTGKPRWDRATVRGILLNPAYTGTARYGKTRLFPRKPGRRPKRGDPQVPRREKVAQATSMEEQEPIPVPALVSNELFDAVAKQFEENRRRHRRQKKGSEFLLSGLLICHQCGSAYCGRRMPRKGGATRYVYYYCIGTDKHRFGGEAICNNKSVNGERLETSVWSDVCNLLQNPGRLQQEFERRLEPRKAKGLDPSHLEDSISRLKRRIARLIDAYENGWLEKSEFEPRISRAKERLAREQETLADHKHEEVNEDELRLVIGEFEAFSERITDGLEKIDFRTKRDLLRLLIKRIEVDETEVRIVYKVQPLPFVHSPAKRDNFLQDCLKLRPTASPYSVGRQ